MFFILDSNNVRIWWVGIICIMCKQPEKTQMESGKEKQRREHNIKQHLEHDTVALYIRSTYTCIQTPGKIWSTERKTEMRHHRRHCRHVEHFTERNIFLQGTSRVNNQFFSV